MKRTKRFIGVAAAGALTLAAIGIASPAYAVGSVSWGTLCLAGYAGSSTYASATGIGNANTFKNGGYCTNIGVALRYSSGWGSSVQSVTANNVSTSRAALISGGWHTDNNSVVTQHAS